VVDEKVVVFEPIPNPTQTCELLAPLALSADDVE